MPALPQRLYARFTGELGLLGLRRLGAHGWKDGGAVLPMS
jgi:hypothetical protein